MTFAPAEIPARAPGVESAQFGPDFVLLDASGTLLRGLNETGSRIWGLIDGARSVQAIATSLAAEFEVPVERTLPDVREFLHALGERRLVERVERSTPAAPERGAP